MTFWRIPPYFSPVARHMERIFERKAKASDQSEDSKIWKKWWNWIHLHDRPMTVPHFYLIHTIRKEDLWVPEWELDWSDQRSDKQTESAEALSILPDSRALLQKLMFCDKLITKTDILCQPNSQRARAGNHSHHLHPFSLSLLSLPDEEEERHKNSPEQSVWK